MQRQSSIEKMENLSKRYNHALDFKKKRVIFYFEKKKKPNPLHIC